MKPAVFLSSLLGLANLALSQPTLAAALDYGTFAGSYSSKYNISYWQRIPFAAPPVGQNRFRAPQPPATLTNGTYNSTQPFDFCPQRTVNGTEDCLYLGLYGRPWTQGQSLRPVVVVFFGGGFIEGGGSFDLPPAGYPVLNVSNENDFIFVYPNYRVNAFGFLPGKEIGQDPYSDLNPGLLDQQASLLWTHKYIEAFGGDPKNVSIWGQSAGAGSVVAQVIANGGNTKPKLFTKALASSPFWPKTYEYDAPQAQSIYDALARMTNCTGPQSLACLKTVDVQTLRTAALAISASHTYNTSSYTWAPVLDRSFLRIPLSHATAKGLVNSDYGWGMYNLHEGENFILPALHNGTTALFESWLRGYLPGLCEADLERVQQMYPAIGTAEEISYNTSYVRAGLIFRDTVLACPAFWMARASHKHSYVGEYTIDPAKHGSDTEWWNRVNAIQTTDPLIYKGYAGAFASFFQTGDPNAHKLTNASEPGVPESRLTEEEFVIEADGFANVPTTQLQARCDFWRSVAYEIPE
ncbi:hypothetical protein LTR86_009319 [Recurvomyces mirabilis]|nr:hypothetical protein LTR86_009319 [Recurvomyces mirabilis]